MSMIWLPLLALGLVATLARMMRGRYRSGNSDAEIDVGSVSESWLAEQRGSKRD